MPAQPGQVLGCTQCAHAVLVSFSTDLHTSLVSVGDDLITELCVRVYGVGHMFVCVPVLTGPDVVKL